MKTSRSPLLIMGLFFIIAVSVAGYLLFEDTTPPRVALATEVTRVAPGQKLTVIATDDKSSIRSVTVTIRKNSQSQVLVQETFARKSGEQHLEFVLKNTFLRDGAFTLILNARDNSFAGFGQGNSVTREYNMIMDTTPPKTALKTQYPYVRRGGTSCVSFTVSREVQGAGVKVGDLFFPAFLQENGHYVCFFAFPHTLTPAEFQPVLVITDLNGNKSSSPLPVYRINHAFRTDTIRINDRFLDIKMPEFEPQIPTATSRLDLFNKVNGELRQSNAQKLKEIGQKSAPVALWDDAFLPLSGGKTMAGFGEHRSYLYNDAKQPVEATHLGLDLASTARAPVPAGNSGVVVFAGYLGIYGNLVVIDHGLGLQSLYSHMSEISVSEGQTVARGDVIGRTGFTGMAVGDHLHFGILMSGIEVSPMEWLDRKWIRDNITGRLEEAGTPGPRLNAVAAAEIASTPAAAPRAKPAAATAKRQQPPAKPAKKR